MALSLTKQNQYRERYKQIRPGWRTSGEVYESLVRQYVGDDAGEVCTLDVGCGAGGVMELFSARVGLSVGVDPDLVSLCGHRDKTIRLTAGRAEALPFGDGTFDLVTCSWVLEHLREPAQTVAEIARVLGKGGHLVLLTPNATSLIVQVNRLVPQALQHWLVRLVYGRKEEDTFSTAYAANSVQAIDSLARMAGLEQVEAHLVSDPTYLAFNELLFRLSLLYESRISADKYAHIVGDYVKV